MKPQTKAFLVAADRALSDARTILSVNIPHQAARLAYYALFHAAQALIFERTDKIAKTHKGVGKEFHRITRSEPGWPPRFAAQLTEAYAYKEHADYDTDFAEPITQSVAAIGITKAETFVGTIRLTLSPT
jgi:uncharacterized protein (UPF0332 family)